ncbi:MAG: ferrous iron transport protein B [Ruminococcaceae bacterium]|nr:ferrous iron transport protein B [Oscillospiraceae bacterium]
MRIALAGNPNSGKTTMYNALTGSNEKVGNWAGVTVDKKEHAIKKMYYKGESQLIAVDLPGAYSMSPFTSEESITSTYVKKENPDVIINIVDATNLSRSLFFTTQILELGIPVVVALNKSDINKKKENKIDSKVLSEKLGCPVIETVSISADGLTAVVKAAVEQSGKEQKAPYVQENIDLTNKEEVIAADRKRFEFVNKIVKEVEKRKTFTKDKNFGDKIDAVLTNRWAGIPIFVVVMWLVFQISQTWLGTWIAEGYEFENGTTIPGLVTLIEKFGEWVGELMVNASPILQTIVIDGIIGGVGAVIGFLPLVMVMYFLLALLEDCGYMARVSVVLDPIFKKVGLSGKSVIPLVIGTGCSIPGIMACRTIRNEKERRATAMLTPFIPCGAKIPVIALFAGLFFPESSWVSPLMYFLGLVLVFFGALLIRWISGYKHKKSYFIIELPEYKIPSFWGAFKSMCSRGWSYIVKAGTIILVCNSVVTIMLNYTWAFKVAEEASDSILHDIATPFAFLLIPLGFGMWQLAAAAITGFIAKEEVVGTLGAVFTALAVNDEFELLQMGNGEAVLGISAAAGLSYLMFNLFSPPCFAAIGAMNAEIKSKKWLFAGIGLQFSIAYVVSFLVYQIGTLITKSTVGEGFIPGLIAVVAIILAVLFLGSASNAKAKKEQQEKLAKRSIK